jgi:hypothetical protein
MIVARPKRIAFSWKFRIDRVGSAELGGAPMGGKLSVWVWIFGILAAVVLAMLRVSSGPWSWDFSHISLIFLLTSILLAIASWIVRWMRYGTEGVTQRWIKFGDGLTGEYRKGPKMRRYLIFWIAVTIALVIFFNVTQQY